MKYKLWQKVELAGVPSHSGNSGRVVGIASREAVTFYIVKLDSPVMVDGFGATDFHVFPEGCLSLHGPGIQGL